MIFEVKTTGICEAKPDIITFNLTFIHKDEDYAKAVDGIAEDIIAFHKLVSNYAKPEDFKTLRYNVERKTKRVEYYNKKEGKTDYRYEFSHYEATQHVKWVTSYDKIKLFKVLQIVSEIGEDGPNVRFTFGLSDDEIAKLENKCTEKALILARSKANAVANTLKMSKVNVRKTTIVESFDTYRELESDTRYERAAAKCLMSRADIETMSESMEPEDVKVEINVISEFEIL